MAFLLEPLTGEKAGIEKERKRYGNYAIAGSRTNLYAFIDYETYREQLEDTTKIIETIHGHPYYTNSFFTGLLKKESKEMKNPREQTTTRLTVRVPEELEKEIRTEAERRGLSLNQMMIQIITRYLKDHQG